MLFESVNEGPVELTSQLSELVNQFPRSHPIQKVLEEASAALRAKRIDEARDALDDARRIALQVYNVRGLAALFVSEAKWLRESVSGGAAVRVTRIASGPEVSISEHYEPVRRINALRTAIDGMKPSPAMFGNS